MIFFKNTYLCITLSLTALATSAFAHEYKKGTLIIDHPITRETPPGTSVGAGYLSITNNSTEDDKLIKITGDLSPVIQIHTMSLENNVIRMEQIKEGLVIPAGKSVQLQPGGKHLMFMNLPQQLKVGEKHKVVLIFEKAGEIEVTFNVEKHNTEDTKHNKSTEQTKHKHH